MKAVLNKALLKMRFPLLVFDWDGTLMDSEARIVGCLQAAARDAGLPVLDEARARNIIGLGLREAFYALFPDVRDDQHERLAAAYRHHFLGNSEITSELFPGVAETLAALRGQGYLLAVATGKGRQGLNHVLEQTGCTSLFHTSRCADETISKPHPQMLLEIMEELEVEPGRTLMVGDTEYDMQMAKQAGVAALAVSYGVHSRERLLGHGPLGCLDRIGDLPVWLAERQVSDYST